MIQDEELGNVESWSGNFECLDNAISYANYEKCGPEYESEVKINQDLMKQIFEDQFPSVDFNCLQRETNNRELFLSITYFQHRESGQIYCWHQDRWYWELIEEKHRKIIEMHRTFH
jgi:hypothetical protein